MRRNPEAWVIDASVAAKWYLRDEELTNLADGFQRLAVSGDADVLAPHLSRHEVANSLASACRTGRQNWHQAKGHLESYIRSGVSLEGDPQWLLVRAAEYAIDFRIAIHDAVYLAMAERTAALLVTADRKLFDAVGTRLAFVHWLGDVRIG